MKAKFSSSTHTKKEHQKRSRMHLPLIVVVVTSLLLAIYSVNDLEWEDKISIQKGAMIFVYGLVFFASLYTGLNGLTLRTSIGQKFIKKYKLSTGDVYDINNKNVSAVQALFCCLTGLTCCWYSCLRDILKTSHYMSEAYAWFGAAYFFYDIWSMYEVHSAKNILNPNFWTYIKSHLVIVGHHLFIGAFGFLVITYLRGGLGDCFFGFVYLMEASTPFVSLRGILSKIGLKQSKLYVLNGLVMVATFFICRVAMFPCVIYLYARTINLDYYSAVLLLPTGCKVSILILLLPQMYWFVLMVKGASQVLTSKSGGPISDNKSTNKVIAAN